MRGHQNVVLRLKTQAFQDIAVLDLRRKGTHRLECRVAGDDDLRGMNALAQQVLAVVAVVGQ